MWTPATVSAGVAPLRIHDLHYTAVSFWIAVGADAKDVATRAGNTSVSVVFDRYGHLLPDRADEVNTGLDAMAAEVANGGAEVRRLPGS